MNLPPAAPMIHPAFAETAMRIVPRREGALGAGESETCSVTADGVTLNLRIGTAPGRATVIEARHSSVREATLRGVVDLFCQAIEGLPLQEAADHGAIHALERLRGDPLVRPVPGILTIHSAGRAFTICEGLIRSARARHQASKGAEDRANFWDPPLSTGWRQATDAERIAALGPIVARFRAGHGLGPDDLRIERIEKTRRVIVGFGPEVGYTAKPALMMRLEVDIRKAIGERLELFMAEAKDSNAIRRLTTEEEAR